MTKPVLRRRNYALRSGERATIHFADGACVTVAVCTIAGSSRRGTTQNLPEFEHWLE